MTEITFIVAVSFDEDTEPISVSLSRLWAFKIHIWTWKILSREMVEGSGAWVTKELQKKPRA